MTSSLLVFGASTLLALGLVAGEAVADASDRPVVGRPVPYEILDPPWLEALQQAQLETVDEFGVFIGFRFQDRIDQSGITFHNRVVEDAGKTYKAVHYDHGNGIAVADVDGDGLYDIYFVNQAGANELWRNLGGGRFENLTERAGVGVADRISVSASFADTDNDGDPDLYVTSVRSGNLLFENLGGGRFVDITAKSGLGHRGHSSGAVFLDYDNDGLLDLYLTNVGQYTSELVRLVEIDELTYRFHDGFSDAFGGHHFPGRTERNRLFRNLGENQFEDRTDLLQDVETGWSGDAAAIDINMDGWQDIYVLNMQGNDQYYENRAGESFVRRSRDVFPRTPWGSMGIVPFDWNNDGRIDIFITDMHSDMSADVGPDKEQAKSVMQWDESHLKTAGASIFGNAFFENRGDGSFVEISDRIGVEVYWPWGASAGDLNADGYQDLFVTASMNYPFRYQTNAVLINDRAKRFRRAEFVLGAEPRKDGNTAQPWFDLDCAGTDRQSHRLCVGADGPVQVWGAKGSRASVIFDLDADGDLDIVTNEFNSQPMVLVSDLAQSGTEFHYLAVRLHGTKSNRSGLGSRVTVKSGEASWTQVLDGKSGYLSQSLLPLYFGLGQRGAVDEVRIVWPSGKEQVLTSPGIDRTLDIHEAE